MKAEAFLFDLDGTLVSTEQMWADLVSAWLADKGIACTAAEALPILMGRSWFEAHAELCTRFPNLKSDNPAQAAQELRRYYAQLNVDPARQVIPSAVAFYRQVARLAPCAIVSGSPHDDVVRAAEACGITRQTKLILGAEDYARGKPAPDSYLKAATLLDVDASQCVVVEDSTPGVRAGRAAGMHVIGIDNGGAVPQDLSGAEWIVHDLSELNVEDVFGE